MKLFFRLCLLLLLTSCSDKYLQPLVFGAVTWPGYEPAYVARELGFLKEDQAHLAEFINSTEVLRAFRNGQLDVGAMTLDEALGMRRSVPDLQIFMVTDFSNGADVLMVPPGIKSLDQLKGKRIGVEKTALGAYYLSLILRTVNLSSNDVSIVSLPLDEQVHAFHAGTVDAVVTFDPVRSELLQQGAEVLFDSTRIPGKIVDVLAIRGAVAKVQKIHLKEFIQAWFRALNVIQHDKPRAYPIMARREQVPFVELERAMPGLLLLDRQQNLQQFAGNPSALLTTSMEIQRVLKENGLPTGSDDLSRLINTELVTGTNLD